MFATRRAAARARADMAERGPLRLGILASGTGTNFEAIADAVTAGRVTMGSPQTLRLTGVLHTDAVTIGCTAGFGLAAATATGCCGRAAGSGTMRVVATGLGFGITLASTRGLRACLGAGSAAASG